MVVFQFAAQHPDRLRKIVLIDAPVPGVGPWEEILKNPLLWHFRFGGPDMERLVAGRERIYLDRFWNEFSADPAHFSEAARQHYAALYALPGAMHSGFAQFAAFDQDAIDNRAFLARDLVRAPVLALGGEKSFGTKMADVMRGGASDVTGGIVPGFRDTGSWKRTRRPRFSSCALSLAPAIEAGWPRHRGHKPLTPDSARAHHQLEDRNTLSSHPSRSGRAASPR